MQRAAVGKISPLRSLLRIVSVKLLQPCSAAALQSAATDSFSSDCHSLVLKQLVKTSQDLPEDPLCYYFQLLVLGKKNNKSRSKTCHKLLETSWPAGGAAYSLIII